MNEIQQIIRESLLRTLAFLASKEQQVIFAAKVHYNIYQDEFACWWSDELYPDEPEAAEMFSNSELQALREFSRIFEIATEELTSTPMPIHSLQATNQWVSVVSGALEATAKLRSAA